MFDKNQHAFLQFRENPLNTEALESEYNVVLPPVYKAFISVFHPYFKWHKVFNESTKKCDSFLTPFYSRHLIENPTIDEDEFAFESFKELEEMLSHNKVHTNVPKGMLFISNHGYSGGLLLGASDENLDKIYHIVDGGEITFEADNIFELISRMSNVECQFGKQQISSSSLYKNWGEDFWRVKKDSQIEKVLLFEGRYRVALLKDRTSHNGCNVVGLDADGEITWRIIPDSLHSPGMPYVSITERGGKLYAVNFSTIQLELDYKTGEVLGTRLLK